MTHRRLRSTSTELLVSRLVEAICQLSRAVLLWQTGNMPDALSALRKAQQIDRRIARIEDLRYEYFWGPKAVAALQAMLACV